MKICVYPGSFDPVTKGHVDIINRSAVLCDRLIVAVGNNINKSYSFNLEERVRFLKSVLKENMNTNTNIQVESFSGLLVEFMKKKDSKVIIKGLRAVSDFEYEFQMALLNKTLDSKIETLFMMSSINYTYLSSSAVKELVRSGGNANGLVPDCIQDEVYEKLRPKSL